ncbi:MAG: MFS transporter [Deltaproteobacteria bacterium]|nr:MFS transporter [Deltaproteobacteria bacterium]
MRYALSPKATLAALTSLNVLNYFDRFLAAAVLPLILADMSLSDAQGGALQSSLMIVYTVICPLAGWLATTQNRFRLAAFGAMGFSLATAGSGLAPSYGVLLIARALVGLGEATYAVVTPTLISDAYPALRRGRAMSFFYAAIPVGTALGYQIGGAVGAAYGYRVAFFIASVPGLLLAVMFLFFRDVERGPHKQAATPPLALGATLRLLRSKRSFVFNTAAQTIYTFAMGGLAVWMPTYYQRQHHLSLAAATMGFGVCVVVAGFAGTLLGGRWGDAAASRHKHGHFQFSGRALLLSAPFSVAAVLGNSPYIYWPGLFLTLFLLFLNTGPLNAAIANGLPPHVRERAFGVNTFCIHALGDVLSPILIGIASDRVGLRIPVLITVLLLACAGFVLLWGRKALVADLDHMANAPA